MAKAKFVLSPADKLSILIATIALISTFFTIYIQFFYRTTNLQVGSISIAQAQDSLSKSLDIDVLFLNSGTNPVAFTKWHSFLSADKSLTKGTCYSNMINLENTALYSYGCDTNINEVIEPNTAEFVKLNLVINKNILHKYIELNTGDNNSLFKVGIY